MFLVKLYQRFKKNNLYCIILLKISLLVERVVIVKKTLYIILLMAMFIIGSVEVNASSGALRKNSIKICNGVMYGQHSSDNHWHVAEESDGKYYATGSPIYSDPCSSNNTTSSNDINSSGSNSNSSNNNSNSDSSSSNGSSSNVNSNEVSNGSNNNSSNSSSNNANTSSSNNFISEKEEVKSNDNTLKTIVIDGVEVDVEDNIEFSTTKESITITATPNDENARYEVKNNSNLKIGDNEISIVVTAEDGTTKTYNINVKRDKILSSDTGFKIIINDEEVKFSDNKARIYVGSDETNLKVDYTLNDKNAKIEMDEIEKLKNGDNELNIKVVAEDGTEAEYKITIHKYTKTEEIIYTILALAILGGIGYGIYYVIKKGIPKLKNTISKNK